ncbi:MAG: alkaline phosphatase family protein [Cyclobacteriaceae bacterium]|nr:alkaline phosphatase family protein [Cyclobacteriaceae bacterium]
MKFFIFLLAGVLAISSCRQNNTASRKELVIAFGSCNRTTQPQDIWPAILANEPDVFIWLGDIIYGDSHNMAVLSSKYKKLAGEPDYQKLAKQAEIIGVWDDHDYGQNDGGKYYPQKDSSKLMLMDFLHTPENDPVRTRAGFYTSYLYGNAPEQVKVILLDARYFRDTVLADPSGARRYIPNPDGDILGEEQWEWLRKELEDNSAKVNIIGCGIQMIPAEHGFEKWANFPKSRERLFNLLNETRPSCPILISGDRHIAELSAYSLDENYTLTEFTSSGLTHTWSSMWPEENRYRIGETIVKRNFGILRIQWENTPRVTLEVRGLGDSLFKEHQVFIPNN